MTVQLKDIEALRQSVFDAIAKATSSEELEHLRVAVLGKKGSLTQVLRSIREVAQEERASFGAAVNTLRESIEGALENRSAEFSTSELEAAIKAEAVDITLPGRAHPIGTEHLISRLTREIVEVFRGIGYRVVEGPEVETEYYNFTALNTPADHPSRSLRTPSTSTTAPARKAV